MAQLSPMLKQFIGIKEEYPDAILFFRMGDFYEMFFDDAITASRILDIALTARGSYNGEKVPMCGVPHHSSKPYLAKLVKSGHKVAICEQTEDPKLSKGIVKREVVRLVTPGSITDEGDLDQKSNIYIAAISEGEKKYGLAHVDLSTGEFRVTEIGARNELLDELRRINPAELLVPKESWKISFKEFSDIFMEVMDRDAFDPTEADAFLKDQLGVRSLDGFGCQNMPKGIIAAGTLLYYLIKTQKESPRHIRKIRSYQLGDFMFLDESTCAHLELIKTMRRQSVKGSLLHALDRTVTPMGSRLLKKWLLYPLINPEDIRKRLNAVSVLKDNSLLREEIKTQLQDIYDIERLNGRISLARANARDLLALKTSLMRLPLIKTRLNQPASPRLIEISTQLDTLQDITQLIEKTINEDPPVSIKDGRIIKDGYNAKLDHLISLSRNGKDWMAEFAALEQKRAGIPKLKIGFNKIYGYYIEISKSNLHLVPHDYIRKQTLVNGERFFTASLKEMEEQILGAEEKRVQLEYQLFEQVIEKISCENQRIKQAGELIAQVDVFLGLAEIAELNNYICPNINDDNVIDIIDGRHPVIEQTVNSEDFVPNDIHLDSDAQQLLIITGPNMAGKSTVLRQTALSVLMAQMGAFVPASKAVIGVVDRIFTRVGASDDLARGQSTFMVEMNETANILHNATPKSLVILDEIGRGTSTYDGLSIAWSVAEELHDRDKKGVRTLFATHYHELTELIRTKKRVKNYNIAVREWNNQIIFLRKLVPGGSNRSYGIQVAQIAGLPEKVILRAQKILKKLEESGSDNRYNSSDSQDTLNNEAQEPVQLSLFHPLDNKLKKWICGLDIATMTPLEALIELNQIKEYASSNK